MFQDTYFDLNIRHFHEKLREEHGIQLSYTWVQKALQGAGLVARSKRRGKHRRRRERRPLPGMLLHIDGSKHQWFGDERWHDLIVILDDATSEIYYAQLVEEESTRTVMAGLWEVIAKQGLFCALYSDRGSHFFVTPKAGEKVDKHRLTQVGRAMKELGVQMIPAYSPQARGRSERSFGTWQGRLPQELRLAGIEEVAEANRFLKEKYVAVFNENERISIRYGPHVVGRYTPEGKSVLKSQQQSHGKDGSVEAVENHKPVSHRSHRPLEIPQSRRDSHFPTASTTRVMNKPKARKPPSASRRGSTGQIN